MNTAKLIGMQNIYMTKAKTNRSFTSGIAIIHSDCILLSKRIDRCPYSGKKIKFPGYWSIFAGSPNTGELPEECAIRELLEESDIKISKKEIYKGFTVPYDSYDFHVFIHKSKKLLIPKLNFEHTAYGWFKLDHLDFFQSKIDKKLMSKIKSVVLK